MSTPIVTGILSYGMSGRVFHAPFIDTNPKFKLRAVTERTTKKAAERYPEIISYSSVDELINDPEIELVIVNTPNHTHYELAKQAILAGKHVLVEKPFAATAAEAKELFELGEKHNVKVFVYQNRRWDSDFQTVKNVIESGKLGTLIELSIRFDRYKNEISKKTFKETRIPASGLTFDLGPHMVDQVVSLFGKPLKWHKSTGIFREKSEVEDYVTIHFEYPNLNVFATASLLTASPIPSFVLNGTKGSYKKERTDVQEAQLELGISPTDSYYGEEEEGKEGQLTLINKQGGFSTEYVPSLKGNYNRLFDAVYASVRKQAPFPVKEEEILWQLEILQS